MGFCANTHVAEHKNGRSYEEKKYYSEGNNVSKSIRHCSYGSFFKTMVTEHRKQTIMKWQENTASSGQISESANNRIGSCHFYRKMVTCTDRKKELNVSYHHISTHC
jgi:hypothetical protein